MLRSSTDNSESFAGYSSHTQFGWITADYNAVLSVNNNHRQNSASFLTYFRANVSRRLQCRFVRRGLRSAV